MYTLKSGICRVHTHLSFIYYILRYYYGSPLRKELSIDAITLRRSFGKWAKEAVSLRNTTC